VCLYAAQKPATKTEGMIQIRRFYKHLVERSSTSSYSQRQLNRASVWDPIATVALILLLVFFGFPRAYGQNDVLTQHNDVSRSGLNPNEIFLTPANVNSNQFGKLFTQNVDGIIVGQPLYASQVLMNDGLLHNVVYVATQHNTVFAFDADNNQGSNAVPLWSVSLNDAGTTDPIADYGCTGTHFTEIGITGTPVIDSAKTTLYVVAKTVIAGQRAFSLHALDIKTGGELLGGPRVITGTAPSSNGSGTFNPIYQLQRPALLLENEMLYIGFGGNGCDEYPYNGWLFAYDSHTLAQQAAFLVTPDGTRASIWQGGSGPAADEFGNIYVVTANGTYDGPAAKNDFGDSVLKMGWDGNSFGVLDYFTPYNQLELAEDDLDLGSSGPLILPDQPGLYGHELVAGGKQGTLYLLNRDNEGQFTSTSDNVIQSIPGAVVSELNGVPSYWNQSVYVAGESDHIKQFALINGALTTTPVSQTTVAFTGPGPASTSISSNGDSNAILWALAHNTNTLYAFDPTNLANEFYNSAQAPKLRDKLSPLIRFATPTISNGKVYIGGKSTLTVYGLLPSLTAVAGNNQTGQEKSVLPVGLSVMASDAYHSLPIGGVSVTCKDGGVGGVFAPGATQVTASAGTATFNYQLPTKLQVVTITCSSTSYRSAVFTETAVIGPPARMTIVSGNNQSALPNTALPNPLVLKVVDSNGFGVPGVTVNFSDNGAGGFFSARSMVTGSNGEVSAQYTTGPTAGKVTVTGSSTGLTSATLKVTVE
jgi:hypothetical protein